jgi:hypothetical protein
MSDAPTGEDETRAAITAFEAELAKTGQDPEGLEAPATHDQVAAAEAALGVKLPPSYKAFLLAHNGGGVYDTSFYGVAAEDGFDLVRLNLRAREDEVPDHLVAFASTISGDVFCFDVSRARPDGECPVLLLDADEGQLIAAAATFLEWLEKLPRLDSELASQRGPQPMTIQEWEEFLKREREKLRKLSRTPARELTMPDPEKVRADLGGKIPVDPRHLKKD